MISEQIQDSIANRVRFDNHGVALFYNHALLGFTTLTWHQRQEIAASLCRAGWRVTTASIIDLNMDAVEMIR